MEVAQVIIERIVEEIPAKLLERLGDLRLGLGGDILPDLAVGQLDLSADGVIGVDCIARVNEEVGGSTAAAAAADVPPSMLFKKARRLSVGRFGIVPPRCAKVTGLSVTWPGLASPAVPGP